MLSSNTSAVSGDTVYVEDVFSTYLYTGTGASQTIVNNIDLSTKGGMTWIKSRSNIRNHNLFDTVRGTTKKLFSNLTNAQDTDATSLTSFNTDGFSLGTAADDNNSGWTYASWTFRKQAKFFDIVTYTGNGVDRNISHNLGSTPGCVIIKQTNAVGTWRVWHRSGNQAYNYGVNLNTTGAYTDQGTNLWGSSGNANMTSTTFSVGGATGGQNQTDTNINGATYVAYLFAHNAGGFGLTGTDNVISCGSYVGDSASAGKFIDLGYEPQWVLQKASSASATDWHIQDVMRGAPVNNPNGKVLRPNSSVAEYDGTNAYPAATGFYATGDDNNSGTTYIYIAIRRGPMKTPTSGTSVFLPTTYTGNGSTQTITTTIRPDFVLLNYITGGLSETFDRLRGNELLYTQANAAKDSSNQYISFANNTGFILPSSVSYTNASASSYTPEAFTRAPSVIDVVCYTGTGSVLNVSHGLTVAPEMMWVKRRDTLGAWSVYHKDVGNTKWANMSATSVPATSSAYWNNTTPTASVFTVGATGDVNASAGTYVAYLFATCPGVSKVGSYTGNGTNQTINCGFSSGARLIMIKRTDAVGSWYLWDSSRGIVSGNDPYIRLNDGSVVTTTDAVDADNSGFIVNQESLNLNVNAATYIFWAVA